MEREMFRAGLAALKAEIKKLTEKQIADKAILRMPRNTEEDRKAVDTAIKATGYESAVRPSYVCDVQSRAAWRKLSITAALSVYANVRGKTHCKTPIVRYDVSLYKRRVEDAQEIFDKAASSKTLVIA